MPELMGCRCREEFTMNVVGQMVGRGISWASGVAQGICELGYGAVNRTGNVLGLDVWDRITLRMGIATTETSNAEVFSGYISGPEDFLSAMKLFEECKQDRGRFPVLTIEKNVIVEVNKLKHEEDIFGMSTLQSEELDPVTQFLIEVADSGYAIKLIGSIANELDRFEVPEWVTELSFIRINGVLDMSGAKRLKKVDFMQDTPQVILGPSVEELRIDLKYGTVDMSKATGLKKVIISGLDERCELKIPGTVLEMEIGVTEYGRLDISDARNLKQCRLIELGRVLALDFPDTLEVLSVLGKIADKIDLTDLPRLESVKIGDIYQKGNLILGKSVKDFSCSMLRGGLDLSTASSLKELKIRRVEEGVNLIVPSAVQVLSIMDVAGHIDMSGANALFKASFREVGRSANVIVGKALKDLSIGEANGTVNMVNACGLKKVSLGTVSTSCQLIPSKSVEEMTIGDCFGSIAFKDFSNLKKLRIKQNWMLKKVELGPSIIEFEVLENLGKLDLEGATGLKKLHLGKVNAERHPYKIGPSVEELRVDSFVGKLDFSAARSLKSIWTSDNDQLLELREDLFWDLHANDLKRGDVKGVERFAEKGDLMAVMLLADLYLKEKFVKQDTQKAIDYYKKAASMGEAFGMYQLGLIYGSEKHLVKDMVLAFEWLRKAYEAGEVNALEYLCRSEYLEVCVSYWIGKFVENRNALNLGKVLRDEEMPKWNIIPVRSSVTEDEWTVVGNELYEVVTKFYPGSDVSYKGVEGIGWRRTNIMGFFTNSMNSSDAKESNGKRVVMQRMVGVVDCLKQWASGNENELVLAKGLMDIMDIHGHACPDRVMVGLDLAESYIKMHQAGGNYLLNVVVNNFKKLLIQEKFGDYKHVENIETYFYYMVVFNELLGLGMPKTQMLYPQHASKMPLYKALVMLLESINAERLIEFVAQSREFCAVCENEKKKIEDSARDEINKLYELNEKGEIGDDELDERESVILNKINRVKHSFFEDKARELLGEKGYLLKA